VPEGERQQFVPGRVELDFVPAPSLAVVRLQFGREAVGRIGERESIAGAEGGAQRTEALACARKALAREVKASASPSGALPANRL